MNEDTRRPRQERCGVPAREQVTWLEMTAYLGVDMDAVFVQAVAAQQALEAPEPPRRRRRQPDWFGLIASLTALALIILVIGVLR